jgi:carbamoyltransferase
MANISFYGSHNAAVVVENKGKILCVIEIERFINVKNSGYGQYMTCITRPDLIKEILNYIKNKYNISKFENCIYSNTDTIEGSGLVAYEKIIPAKNFKQVLHHQCHASSAFYQTNYKKALIISFDGGGNDGFFNIYEAKDRNTIEEIDRLDFDLGFAYMSFGEFLNDIKRENSLGFGNLVYSGKIMGLCSYGTLKTEWLDYFKEYYRAKPNGNNFQNLINELGSKIGVTFSTENRLAGEIAWDIAKTSQIAFEEVFLELAKPYLDKYKKHPLILVGGCALNILLNTRLKEEYKREVFVPPNPNDCGIASGLLLDFLKPKKAVDLTYAGIEVLDKDCLMMYIEKFYTYQKISNDILVDKLIQGNIVGVVRDTSEHGPRALGNRSILCNPAIPHMKDILNQKVKNREWYRPFAPVVRLEDVSKYFEFDGESRWMSFCPKVREEYRNKLVSITHVDGTARVQTVTRNQNPWLYDLLTDFEKQTGFGVLLNTSFNVDGKPILSTYKDACEVFERSRMDALVLQDYIISK